MESFEYPLFNGRVRRGIFDTRNSILGLLDCAGSEHLFLVWEPRQGLNQSDAECHGQEEQRRNMIRALQILGMQQVERFETN